MVNSVDLFKRNGMELKWNAFLKEQHFHVHTLAIWSDKGSLFHLHILADQRRYAIVFVQRSQHHIYYLYQVIYREFRYPPTVLHSNLKGKPQILQSATISIFPYSLIGPALSLHLSHAFPFPSDDSCAVFGDIRSLELAMGVVTL